MQTPKLTWLLYANPVYVAASPLIRDLSKLKPSQAQFSTIADGGFADGTLQFDNVSPQLFDEIWETWLVKRVTAVDGAGRIAYEGFVSEISATRGYHTYNQTVDAFTNRVFVEYTYAGGTCSGGATCYGRAQRNETNVDSTAITQTTIGIKEEWLDATGNGTITSAMANAMGDKRLLERIYQRSNNYMLGGGAEAQPASITLTIVGYYATLQWRKQSIVVRYATPVETIINNLLTVGAKCEFLNTSAYDYVSTGRSITYNSNAALYWISDYIQDIIASGDSNGRRLLFQIWEDRTPYLSKRATAPKYFSASNDFRVYNSDRGSVPAYMVRAGGYIMANDMRAAMDENTDVGLRRRASFIEQTTYDAINDTLTIPPPSEQVNIERLLARARKQARKHV